jgi:hypothetical protein
LICAALNAQGAAPTKPSSLPFNWVHVPLDCAAYRAEQGSIARIHDCDAATAEAIAADRMMPRGARSEADTTRFAGSIIAGLLANHIQPSRRDLVESWDWSFPYFTGKGE